MVSIGIQNDCVKLNQNASGKKKSKTRTIILMDAALQTGKCVFISCLCWSVDDILMAVNSLGFNDAIWRQGYGSTLAQVMACCLTAPSHYLNQCWLIIRKVKWYSFEDNFTSDISGINHWNKLENIPLKSPRGLWVNLQESTQCGAVITWINFPTNSHKRRPIVCPR